MRRTMVCLLAGLLVSRSVGSADRPNIFFMLADDQDWNGFSVAMHSRVSVSKGDIDHMPNLERLASQGMRFSMA